MPVTFNSHRPSGASHRQLCSGEGLLASLGMQGCCAQMLMVVFNSDMHLVGEGAHSADHEDLVSQRVQVAAQDGALHAMSQSSDMLVLVANGSCQLRQPSGWRDDLATCPALA